MIWILLATYRSSNSRSMLRGRVPTLAYRLHSPVAPSARSTARRTFGARARSVIQISPRFTFGTLQFFLGVVHCDQRFRATGRSRVIQPFIGSPARAAFQNSSERHGFQSLLDFVSHSSIFKPTPKRFCRLH